MSITGYQSDSVRVNRKQGSTQGFLSIIPVFHLKSTLTYSPNENVYSVINENLIVGKDIRLRPNTKKLIIKGWQISFPAPLLPVEGILSGTLKTIKGQTFFYTIDGDGRIFLDGTFIDSDDELILNINPYVAEVPLRFREFPAARPRN